MELIELDTRLTPSVAVGSNGVFEGRYGEALLQPFGQFYTGPLDVVEGGEYRAAAAVNRVNLYHNDTLIMSRYAFEDTYTDGLSIALTNDRLYVGASKGGPRLLSFDLNGVQVDDRFVFEPSFRGGITVRGFKDHLLVGANDAGGTVAELDGVRYQFGDASYRGQRVWGLADTGFTDDPTVLLATHTNIASFTMQGVQLTAAFTVVPYTSLGSGSFTLPGRNMVLASNGDGYDEIDVTTGTIIQYYEDSKNVRVGQSVIAHPGFAEDTLIPFSLAANAGGSVGSELGTGTITAPVYIDGVQHGLTNRHVAGTGTVSIPGRADGTPKAVGQVVRASDFVGKIDSAVFTTSEYISPVVRGKSYNRYTKTYYDIEITPAGVAELRYGQLAYKAGRTTGFTVGVVTDTEWAGVVGYPGFNVPYTDQNIVYGFNAPFAEPGDSGSPVLVYDGGWKIAGQLFAGGGFSAVITDINDVLTGLQVTL